MRKLLTKRSSFEIAPTLLKFGHGIALHSMFVLPILILYYQTKDMSVGDFFLLQFICSVTAFLIEIPTGYIGDVFDRKKTVSFGVFLWLLGNIFIFTSDGFLGVAVGEITFGFAMSLLSGTTEAYLYDLLKYIGRKGDALKEQASMDSIGQWMLCFSCLIGGFLYKENIEFPIIFECIFALIGFLFIVFLPSVPMSKEDKENRNTWLDIKNTVHYSLKGHPEIKWLIFYSAVLFGGTHILFWGIQLQAEGFNFSLEYFGLILAINFLFKAVFSGSAVKITDKFGLKKSVIILFPIVIISLFSFYFSSIIVGGKMSNWVFILITIMATSFVHGFGSPVFVTLINNRVASRQRATVLSVSAFVRRILAATIFFAMKFLIDGIGIYNSMLVLGFLFLFGIIPLVKLIKLKIL